MKITYEFDPYEDKTDLEIFQQSMQMCLFIYDFEQHLRKLWKYPPESQPEEVTELIDKLYSEWFEMKNEREIKDAP